MKTSGLFTAHAVDLCLPRGAKSFKIVPFGDVHRESALHASKHWKDFLSHAQGLKNALFLGMGDYSDGVSTSERAAVSAGNLHETTKSELENLYKGHTKTLAKELGFMRGKLIGLLGGNHYYPLDRGQTTDHMLAEHLGTKFLGVSSLIRLRLSFEGDRYTRLSFDIFAHHGKGGGTLPGSTFNTLEKMTAIAEADLYLMGHDHKKGCIPSSPRLQLATTRTGSVKVTERSPWLGRTGSFLKAYESDEVSYNVDAGRSACALGWIEFDVTVVRAGTGDRGLSFRVRGTS